MIGDMDPWRKSLPADSPVHAIWEGLVVNDDARAACSTVNGFVGVLGADTAWTVFLPSGCTPRRALTHILEALPNDVDADNKDFLLEHLRSRWPLRMAETRTIMDATSWSKWQSLAKAHDAMNDTPVIEFLRRITVDPDAFWARRPSNWTSKRTCDTVRTALNKVLAALPELDAVQKREIALAEETGRNKLFKQAPPAVPSEPEPEPEPQPQPETAPAKDDTLHLIEELQLRLLSMISDDEVADIVDFTVRLMQATQAKRKVLGLGAKKN